MKSKLFFALAVVLLGATACGTKPTDEAAVKVYWQGENLPLDSTGVQYYKQIFTVSGDLSGVERLCFNQFARPMESLNPADTIIEFVPGYYAIASPRFKEAASGDTLVFEIMTKGSLWSICYGPDGVHTVDADGKTAAVDLSYFDISADPKGYATETLDRMPYGDAIYAINEQITSLLEQNKDFAPLSPYDVVPSFKQVELTGGESAVDLSKIEFKAPETTVKEGEYAITVADGKMTVVAEPKMWRQLGTRLAHFFGTGIATLPNAQITDYPSLEYRGLMIDIARNYQTPAEIYRVLELMAIYGLNRFHFHMVDDEAWRIEIAGLPELTEVGSRRGYGFDKTGEYLPQIFAGNGKPDNLEGTANGYFTRQDYIDMLRHADSLGIVVIPEIESPGHARAAINAMKLRAKRLGDESLLLREEADTSSFVSAQSFHDNTMNPALEGPYKLMDKVADELIAMHREAGVPLRTIHIGGDEVPSGAWNGSPAVAALMEKEGFKSDKEIHAYFVKRIRNMYASKGLMIGGWQEIALRHSDDYNTEVRPSVYMVNCWQTNRGGNAVANDLASAGYPVVLSNVQHFYLDMTYSYHPDERGLSWGGTTDEFSALHGYPSLLCTVPDANVIGVSGHVWAETIRGAAGLETMLLPKMLGLAERGWNPDSTYTDGAFHAVILKEIPRWEAAGFTYHVRQPGIKLLDGGTHFTVNSPYPDAVIRYTLDGTKPGENSPVAKPGAEIAVGDASRIRATLWLNGHPSATTILLINN